MGHGVFSAAALPQSHSSLSLADRPHVTVALAGCALCGVIEWRNNYTLYHAAHPTTGVRLARNDPLLRRVPGAHQDNIPRAVAYDEHGYYRKMEEGSGG